MSKLSTGMSNEIASVVERKLQGFLNVNKYDLFKEVRTATGEYVRYRDVRDEIDHIIFNVADKLELNLEKYFVRNADGKVYVFNYDRRKNTWSLKRKSIMNLGQDNVGRAFITF